MKNEMLFQCATQIYLWAPPPINNTERLLKAELYRRKSQARLLVGTAVSDPRHLLNQAVAIARRQHAGSLELRSATHLADKHNEAVELPAPLYAKFQSGLDRPSLRYPKPLPEGLQKTTPSDPLPLAPSAFRKFGRYK